MVGGEGPSGLVTLKVSVRHWPMLATDFSGAGALVATGALVMTPDLGRRLATEDVSVLGPEMVKVIKSSLICRHKREFFSSILNIF